jgi:DNA primase
MKGLGPEEYEKRIEEAENSFLFSIRMMEADYDMQDPTGKTAFQNAIAKRILEFPEELERNNYMEAVALHYQFPLESLRQLVVHLAAKEGSGITAARPANKPKATNFAKQQLNREDGPTKSQMLLLTWIAEDAGIYRDIKSYISPEDFNEGILRDVATALFAQIEAGEQVNPAKISSGFVEEEQQRQVAKMFNTPVTEDAEANAKDLGKALKETVIRIKEESLERQRKAADPSLQMKLMLEHRELIANLKKHDFYHRQ